MRSSPTTLRLWLDQPDVPIGPAEHHGDAVAGRVPEDDHGVAAIVDHRRRRLDRHRTDGIAAAADDTRAGVALEAETAGWCRRAPLGREATAAAFRPRRRRGCLRRREAAAL